MADMNRTPICPYADTAENLELRNDVLLQGQIVYNLTNNTYKVGDGKSHWTEITTEYKYGDNGTIIEDGGSNDFIVNFTIVDENMNCTTDKTFAEIQTAKQEGFNIYGTVEIIQDGIPVSVKVPLTLFNEYGFYFTGIYVDMSLVLTIMYDGVCSGSIATLAHFDALGGKANKATTLEGYGITDAYTKEESDDKYLTEHQSLSEYAKIDDIIQKSIGEHSVNYMPPVEEFESGWLMQNNTLYSSTSYITTGFIEVPSNSIMTIQQILSNTWTITTCRSFMAYDENKNPISSSYMGNTTSGTLFPIPENARYIRVSLTKTYITTEAMQTMIVVNRDGSLIGKYVENKMTTVINLNKDISVTDDNLKDVSVKHKKSLKVSALSQQFSSYESTNADYISTSGYLNTANKVDWLYGLYDELMEAYPDYITKTKIAETAEPADTYNANGELRTDLVTGLPMYRYDFKPPVADKTITGLTSKNQCPELPKILYTGGIHGGEYFQVIAAFRFFKMLCEKWREYEVLSDLRWNVHFVIIPITNPFGFNYPSGRVNGDGVNVSKLNERHVDISGNYPSAMYENGGSDNPTKYGTSALSEPESQALYKIIQEEDFILSVDNHTFNYLSGAANTTKMAGYFIPNYEKENSVDFWFKISRWLNQHVRKCSSDIDNTYDSYDMGEIWTDSKPQILNNTFRSVGANVEMTLGIHPTDSTLMAEETQAFCVDELAVIFYEAFQDFYTY